MIELVEYIVKSLVLDENSVKVTLTKEDDGEVIHIFVAADDMGRVIGRNGKIASGIRAIVKSMAARDHKKVFVRFGE